MEPYMEKLLEIQNILDDHEIRLRQADRTIAGIKHYLKIAADYRNDVPEQVLRAIQAALGEAAKYEGRKQNKRRR